MTRTELINYIIKKQGYKYYVEIGVGTGKNFAAVNIKNKIGVDPDKTTSATLHCTSDYFFEARKRKGYADIDFDIIFIDGLHEFDQVRRDIINAWECLTNGGTLIIHDTNPDREEITRVPRETKEWTGDVYRTIYQLKNYKVTFEGDHGVTILHKTGELNMSDEQITWEEFDAFRDEILNLRNWEETIKIIDKF